MSRRLVAAYSLLADAWSVRQRVRGARRWLVVISLRGWSADDVTAAGYPQDAEEIDVSRLGRPTIEARTEIETGSAIPLMALQGQVSQMIASAAHGEDAETPMALVGFGRVEVFMMVGRK